MTVRDFRSLQHDAPPTIGLSPEQASAGLRGATLLRIAGVAMTCAISVSVSVALIDRPVATWVHQHLGSERFGWFTVHYSGQWLRFGLFTLMASPAEALQSLAIFAFATLAIAACAGWRPDVRGRIVLALCVSVLAALGINGVAKVMFGRTWPESWLGDNPSWIRDGVFGFFPFHQGAGWGSFPSGHTAAITAVAALLWFVWPKSRVVWAILVAGVVAGLIGANYHFVSDIVGGLYLGAAVGLGTARLMLSPSDDLAPPLTKRVEAAP